LAVTLMVDRVVCAWALAASRLAMAAAMRLGRFMVFSSR
jgi:hypothetical protein